MLSCPNKTFAASGGSCAITMARRCASSAAVSCAEASLQPRQISSVNMPHRQRLLTMVVFQTIPPRFGPAGNIGLVPPRRHLFLGSDDEFPLRGILFCILHQLVSADDRATAITATGVAAIEDRI